MAKNEIRRSKDLLEQHLGQDVTSFAYPYGYYTSDVQRLTKEAGFTSACTVNNVMCSDNSDHFALERLAITPNMGISAFDALLNQKRYSQLRKVYQRARIPVKHTFRCFSTSISRFYSQIQGSSYQDA
jgi:peptidoglycan/xylan/chitin deacetylase (PgdA/CDA1 family)